MAQYFRLNGLTGMLIAVVLLLSILAFLTVNAISVQAKEAKNFYKIENPYSIQMKSTENEKLLVDAN